MSYQAGDTYPAKVDVRDESGTLIDPPTLTMIVRDAEGTETPYVYGIDDLIIRDSEGVYHADVLLDNPGMWVVSWATTDEEQVEGVQISVSPAPTASVTFATIDELALRLGKTGATELTDAQTGQGRMLLELVTGIIVEEVDRNDDWAATLYPIPRVVRGVCLEAVARVMQNPSGMTSESETLGAYSHTTRYEGPTSGAPAALQPSDAEIRMCRRAILGTLSGSSCVDSLATQLGGRYVVANPVIYEDIT